ncbi:MAG: hypothetical protein LBV12_12360 [Puniceicoccales bacterium]|nr:hypothetical protein [Puniceicoccales bacterium]
MDIPRIFNITESDHRIHNLFTPETSEDAIEIVGASENNLKHINLTIPKKRLVVLAGVSGSGKSSLAFDNDSS